MIPAVAAALLRRCRRPRAPYAAFAAAFSSAPHCSGEAADEKTTRSLRRRVLRLRSPEQSAAVVIDRWSRVRGRVSTSTIDCLVADLRRRRRYEHALQILVWMESSQNCELSASGQAARLDLIAKVYGVAQAEKLFSKLPGGGEAKLSASVSLLRCYVQARDVENAETVMAVLQREGLLVDCRCFNEMMKLYIAKNRYEEVLAIIQYMDQHGVARDALSYHMWLTACAEVPGAGTVESVLEAMRNDTNVEVGHKTYCTLATVYRMQGNHAKSLECFQIAEQKLSRIKRPGYSSVMMGYALLNHMEGVSRIWGSREQVPDKITCAEYMSAMLSFIKIGCIKEAGEIFASWDKGCRNYDMRVPNVLLGAYMRGGQMDKAEGLFRHALERGARPNYKTWEILMEGWTKDKQMDRAVEALRRSYALLRHCHWRPPAAILEVIARHFEEHGLVNDAKRYASDLRQMKLMSLPLYKSYLRTYINANILPSERDVFLLVEKERVLLDEECEQLIFRACQPHVPTGLIHDVFWWWRTKGCINK